MRILLGRVKGDKGERGAQGPKGPRGERGPQGPPGEPGQTDIYTRAESDARYQLKGTYASVEYVDGRVANIVNSAPETLDTLQELAQALGNDPNFATTVANKIGTKADKATTENALKGKANAADVYTRTETTSKLNEKANKQDVANKTAITLVVWG